MSLFDGQPLTREDLVDRELRKKRYVSKAVTIVDKKGRIVRRRPYWEDYGKGPAGKTCGDCKHITYGSRFRYKKCGRHPETAGPGTDIRMKDDACRAFEEGDKHVIDFED